MIGSFEQALVHSHKSAVSDPASNPFLYPCAKKGFSAETAVRHAVTILLCSVAWPLRAQEATGPIATAEAAGTLAITKPGPDGADGLEGSEPSPAVYPRTIPVGVPGRSEDAVGTKSLRRAEMKVDDIVVTARRAERGLRSPPASVSTVEGDRLRDFALSDLDDVARLIPNVSSSIEANSLYMRGIGTAEINIVSEQAVSYVMDGVYVPRVDYLKPGLLDVDYIEIIKGPQVTMFGRNATAGVVNIVYQEPTRHWESRAALTKGSRNLQKMEAVVSGPLDDAWSFRMAGSQLKQDGHTFNRANGDSIGDKDTRQVRAKFRYEASDDLDVSLSGSYFDYLIGVWAVSEASEFPAALHAVVSLLDPSFEAELDHEGSANARNRSEGRGMIIPLKISYAFDGHVFTSTTSYSRLEDFQGGDIDGSAIGLAELQLRSHSDVLSQEFRLVSAPGIVSYSGGLLLFRSQIEMDSDVSLLVRSEAGAGSRAELLESLAPSLAGVLDQWAGQIFPGDAADNLDGRVTADSRSIGLFGEMTWNASETLALSVGGRYSRYVTEGSGMMRGEGLLPLWSLLLAGGYRAESKIDQEEYSPKFAVTWAPFESASIYGSYARGFRAGGYNAAAFSESDLEFRAERTSSHEAGLRARLLNGRVRINVGVFRTLYEDYQLATFNGFGYNVSNAEKVRSSGVEADLSAMLLPGLTMTVAAGYNKGVFVEHPAGACATVPLGAPGGIPPQGIGELTPERTCDLSGAPLFRTPEWNGSLGIAHEGPVSGWPIRFLVGASASYKGSEFMDADLDSLDRQEGYWLHNAHLGLKHPDGRWSLTVHGTNLGDKRVKTFSGDIPLLAGGHRALTHPPRAFSITLQIHL